MSGRWETVAARARGLATHLLDEATLAELGRVDDRRGLARILGQTPHRALLSSGGDPAALDVAVARHAAAQIATLIRWIRPRERLLDPLLLPLDAGAIRGIARGIRGGVGAGERIAEVVPTPRLGRGELELLAATRSVSELATLLMAWEHPLGSPIPRAVDGTRVDDFALEAALARALGPAMDDAARGADDLVRTFVGHEIDAWNVGTALVLADGGEDAAASELWVEGGSALSRADFLRAGAADGRSSCAEVLSTALRGTLLAAPLSASPPTPAAVDDRILDARIRRLTHEGRIRPLSAAPVLSLLLRLRREGRALRRASWRTSLTSARAA